MTKQLLDATIIWLVGLHTHNTTSVITITDVNTVHARLLKVLALSPISWNWLFSHQRYVKRIFFRRRVEVVATILVILYGS